MAEEELRERATRAKQENDAYRAEIALFESFLQRNPLNESERLELGKAANRKKQRPRSQKPKHQLTVDQKLVIATSELEHLKNKQTEAAKSAERMMDNLHALIEETEIRIAELRKEAYEFKRDIVVGGENFRTGKVMAEKVVRYMEEKLRQKEAVVEKLRLKNGTLKGQISKVEAQLTQKEEMGEVLHYIDFHQQEIENKRFVALIEQRNSELLRLKKTTGRTVQVLNNLKKRLSDLMAASDWLKSEIKSRTDLLKKISEETARVEASIDGLRGANTDLKRRQEDTAGMPQVVDYVKQKAEMYELQNAVRNWERKVEIATMGYKRAKALRRTMDTGSVVTR